MSPKPGVLCIVNSLTAGGAEKQTISLLNGLDANRFRLCLAYLKPVETLLPQVQTDRLEMLQSTNVRSKLDWNAVRSLAAEIDRRRIDVILCANQYAGLYGWLARSRARHPAKVIEVLHGTLLLTLKDKIQMAFYKRLFRRVDLMVYVCENQRRYWRGEGLRAPVECVIYNGVDVEHFERFDAASNRPKVRGAYGFQSEDYVIGICATLRHEKAHPDLLNALARLRSNGIPAKALIIGDGPERGRIEQVARDLGIEKHIVITGFQADVRPFVAACDVMTLVSHSVETFSIAALESMAMGKAMLMTRIGGADEQVIEGKNGMLFEPGDIDALTGKLATLYDPAVRLPMGEAARLSVRSRFGIEQMLDAYSETFMRLAQGSAEPALRLAD
jgi:glycosyltransferase involved in cell wall biosynthesis